MKYVKTEKQPHCVWLDDSLVLDDAEENKDGSSVSRREKILNWFSDVSSQQKISVTTIEHKDSLLDILTH